MAGTARRLTTEELDAWTAFRLMSRRLEAHLARELARASDLSMQDYDVLSSVAPLPGHRGGIKELAQHLEWSYSRLSHHLDRMSRRNLVRREPAIRGLGTDVVLTDAGMAAIRGAAGPHLGAVRTAFLERLEPGDLAVLQRAAAAVLAWLPESELG